MCSLIHCAVPWKAHGYHPEPSQWGDDGLKGRGFMEEVAFPPALEGQVGGVRSEEAPTLRRARAGSLLGWSSESHGAESPVLRASQRVLAAGRSPAGRFLEVPGSKSQVPFASRVQWDKDQRVWQLCNNGCSIVLLRRFPSPHLSLSRGPAGERVPLVRRGPLGTVPFS